jgi:hypothetical protein
MNLSAQTIIGTDEMAFFVLIVSIAPYCDDLGADT